MNRKSSLERLIGLLQQSVDIENILRLPPSRGTGRIDDSAFDSTIATITAITLECCADRSGSGG